MRDEKGRGGPGILVVDDDEAQLMVLTRALEKRVDLAVESFNDSGDALSAIESREYALVVTDLEMPSHDGIAVLRATRERWPLTEVVVVSGLVTMERAVDALKLHAFDIVLKPFKIELFCTTVARALAHRELVLENRRMTEELRSCNQDLQSRVEQATLELRAKVGELDALSGNLRAILENMPAGCLILDSRGLVYQANLAAAALLGYPSAASALGEPVPGDERCAPLREFVASVPDDGTCPQARELRLASASGEPLLLRVAARRVRGASGSAFVLVMLEDVTTVSRMEAALRKSERLATVGGLAAGIAHEIKNPLGAIRGMGELLSMKIESIVALKRFSDSIMSEVDRLNRIVDDVSRFAREVTPRLQDVELGRLLADLAERYRNLPQRRRVTLELKGELPRIPYDEAHLKRALENLLDNALQATAEGGVIAITGDVKEGQLVLHVRDEGVGIAPEFMAQLFRPFFSTRQPRGSGLGLCIADKVIRDHGGSISVASKPGQGTDVTVVLPAGSPVPKEGPDAG